MDVVVIIIEAVMCVFAVVLIFTVLLQPSKRTGISGQVGGGAESIFGKKKARGIEARMAKLTKISAVCFMALAVALMVIQKFFS